MINVDDYKRFCSKNRIIEASTKEENDIVMKHGADNRDFGGSDAGNILYGAGKRRKL